MSSRILTTSIAGIDAFMRDPRGVLTHAEGGMLAVLADNAPAFYAITPERLAQLLEIEARLSRPASDVTLDNQFFEEPGNAPVTVPMGKFALYAGWHPDVDFQRQAALWGIALTQPATPEELAAFIAWWQAEGKVFTHIQWQQKLARHLQINRASNNGQPKRDINAFSEPDKQIPNGFRGAK
ncbi:primosomal protein DnaT [Enterobacter cloacae]|uniref:primosomal protein DnaT n=1 Tax=Enterobacter cloacae TaxID=550 RepID=UPI000798A063|nr:primosomal protein DnaT [Enterobacter cloacae]ELV2784505.1 primosomal protein DnaT [Enterobacter cloacae]MCK7043652.1 primosomal protein DnaT [Enterobacter cloacae]MDM6888915.1 primosomal protein DnaT [Enterobacter cloacae]QCZ38646.1 primosomal protein DnaT [Enterobacter cloacae]RXX51959.1 primosomal protein DnaT [Enterobacter cloacae]